MERGLVETLLVQVSTLDLASEKIHDVAAQLSNIAAKAEDEVLILLSHESEAFVSWLCAEEPVVRAYTACIIANVAFLEVGQRKVLDAQGVPPLVRLLKTKDNKKVTLPDLFYVVAVRHSGTPSAKRHHAPQNILPSCAVL